MTNEPEFPPRTAGTVSLPSCGDTVWVQTLNTLLLDQAQQKARRHAQNECRSFIKGGVDYPAVVAEVRGMSIEAQSAYLAEREYFAIRTDAETAHPDPREPEQGEMTPEEYIVAVQKWEAARKKAAAKRAEFEKKRYDAECAKAAAYTAADRRSKCCSAYVGTEFATAFVKRMTVETLCRAVRLADDHTQRYFANVESVEDLDDADFQALYDFYFREADTVTQEAIPTSPAAS